VASVLIDSLNAITIEHLNGNVSYAYSIFEGASKSENNTGTNVNITNALISEIGIREAEAMLGSIRTVN
jgi:hypothetical protein